MIDRWTLRWILLFCSLVITVLLGMAGYHESREVGVAILCMGGVFEAAGILTLWVGMSW